MPMGGEKTKTCQERERGSEKNEVNIQARYKTEDADYLAW